MGDEINKSPEIDEFNNNQNSEVVNDEKDDNPKNLEGLQESAEITGLSIDDSESDTPQETEKTPQEIRDGINKFNSDCLEIGLNSNLSPKEKVEAMQKKFAELGDGNRGDAQCLSSEKYLNEKEPFDDEGRARVGYPGHLGFNMENGRAPEPISRDNPMQDSVDRYGPHEGTFVAGIENGEPASFESRATPNIENPDSYHSYKVDNGRYCDAVDLVRNCDPENMEPSIDSINDMIDSINQEHGLDLDHIDSDDMEDMLEHYDRYQRQLANDIPEINPAEAPYGLSGEAAPWDSASGERLSDGGCRSKMVTTYCK